MYAPYIMFGYAASMAFCLLGLFTVRRSIPDLRGFVPLCLYVSSGLLGVLLLASRALDAGRAPIVAGNFLLILGSILFCVAAAQILSIPLGFLRSLFALPFVTLPVFYWSAVHPDIRLRILAHCSGVTISYLATAILLFRHRDDELRPALRPAAWTVSFMAALQVAWMLYPWLFRVHPDFLHPDSVDAAFSYLSMMAALACAVALIWLSLSLHRNELHRAAQTDSLTGLLNRGAFETILRRELQRSHRSGAHLGLMLIDLDYFKQVNDSYGHHVGDSVLRHISSALSSGTRPSDVLARYGGEEFVVLLRNAGLNESHIAAERLRLDIAALANLPEHISLTVSIGVAVSVPGESPHQFLLRADEALYRSKHEGRNLVSVHRAPQAGNLISV